MSRKIIALLGVIALLMTVATCALAENWFCPECGTENSGNFCFNCGEKKPGEVSGGAGIDNVQWEMQDNGDVVISWDDSSNSPPYTVTYQAKYDRHTQDPVSSKSITLEYLIPSETYTIRVSNGKSEATTELTVPVKVYTEFSSSAKRIALTETTFSISRLEQDKTKSYELRFHYPQLRTNRSYKGKLVMKTPYGYGGKVTVYPQFDLESRYSYIYTIFSIHEVLEGVKADFNEIPTGKYTLEMYFDGQLYADTSFNVTR